MGGLIVLVVFLILAVLILLSCIKIVPQARFSIAMIGFSTPYAKSFGSVIWKNTTVSIRMVR